MTSASEIQSKTDAWFDEIVGSIKADQLAIERGVASDEKVNFYDSLRNRGVKDMMDMSIEKAQQYYIQNMLVDYIKVLAKHKYAPFNRLAVSFHNAELLVWAEIPDDSDQIEGELIMAEAKINAKYHSYGFDMVTTIVEACDKLPVPEHYHIII